MKFKVFIGVDVSKNWLDYEVMSNSKIVLVQRHDNNAKGIADFVRSPGLGSTEASFLAQVSDTIGHTAS